MTIPLYALLFFTAWTLLTVILIGVHRWSSFFAGKVPKEGFPSDVVPADGWYRRLMQAHRNCVENLVVFGAINLLLAYQGLVSETLNQLAIAVVLARIGQTLVHISFEQLRPVIMVRFTFYVVQIICFIWMLVIAFQG